MRLPPAGCPYGMVMVVPSPDAVRANVPFAGRGVRGAMRIELWGNGGIFRHPRVLGHDLLRLNVVDHRHARDVTWAEPPNTPVPVQRRQLHRKGIHGTTSEGTSYTVRSDEAGRYEFTRVVPGPYKLTDAIAARPTWRLKLQVERGNRTVLDLSPGNSGKVRDDFPG